MAKDKKNLSDDLNDMIGDAKEGVKKAADKAGKLADEAVDKAADLADDAKEAVKDLADDAKKVLSDGKNVAIIAHITIIGWIIALVMSSSNKTELGSFYIRQTLGIYLLGLLIMIPLGGGLVSLIVSVVVFLLWIMSLIGALGGNKKPVFLLGQQFQDWFKSL